MSLIHRPLIAEQLRHSVVSGLLLTVAHRYREDSPHRPCPRRRGLCAGR
jgi:hypothetical protein